MTKRTLGGERLGSGKKFQVDIGGFNRSTHDLSYLFKTTMSCGTLVPFMAEIGLPGDTFDIDLDVDIKTHPTIGPLFGSFKIQLDIFKADLRLYQGKLHNNKLNVGYDASNIKWPKMRLWSFKSQNITDDLDNSQINPSCILSYLDIRGVKYIDAAADNAAKYTDYTALKLLAYWDCYKNYYANKQELTGAVIRNTRPPITVIDSIQILNPPSYSPVTLPKAPASPTAIPISPGSLIRLLYTTPVLPPNPQTVMVNVDGQGFVNLTTVSQGYNDTGTYVQVVYEGPSTGLILDQWRDINASDIIPAPPQIATFALDNIDDMREAIMGHTQNNTPYMINDLSLAPYEYIALDFTPSTDYDIPYTQNQEGLAIKTYQSDQYNNWLRTETIIGPDSISEVTAIDTAGGSFTMDQLNLAQKVYNMLNKIAVSGGSYDDYIEVVYNTRRMGKSEIPVYCGGLIRELVFQEVVSNAEAGDQPLGTLAGKGIMSGKKKGGSIHIKTDEPCYIMGIISITPRLDYSQGNKWDSMLDTLDDLHKPDLDGIGFQALLSDEMAWWTKHATGHGGGDRFAVGYQPAWINYQTNTNKTRGNFAIANSQMFMTLNRRYERDGATGNIKDLTTYIDPSKFNHIFAQTSLDAQNYWAQIACNIISRRVMSARQIPNL